MEGYNVGLEALLWQGVSGPEFCGDFVCRFGRVVGKSTFSGRFGELIDRCEGVCCGLDVVRWAACLVVGSVVVGGCASLRCCSVAFVCSGTLWGFHECLSLFVVMIGLLFVFSLWCLAELGAFLRAGFCVFLY